MLNEQIDKQMDSVIQIIQSTRNPEPRIQTIVAGLVQQCQNDANLLNYLLDTKKDDNKFKKDLAIRVLGEIKSNDQRVLNYLLMCLKSKTNIESYLGYYTPSNTMSILALGACSIVALGVGGYIVGGPVGSGLGFFTGFKATQTLLPYISEDSLRKNAVISLKKLGNYSDEVLEALADRINDPNEQQHVKEEARRVLQEFNQLKNNSDNKQKI